MERTLMRIAALGAAVSAGFGAVAGAGLRVDPERTVDGPMAPAASLPISFEPAPAYPLWAPPPLYGDREDEADFFDFGWLPEFGDEPAVVEPARFEPPPDLPPPYEVRLSSDPWPPLPPPGYDRRRSEDERRYDRRRRDEERRYAAGPPPHRFDRPRVEREPYYHPPEPVRRERVRRPPPLPPEPMRARAWIDPEGRLYVESPPPPPPAPEPPPPPMPPPMPPQGGPPLDRAALFF